MHWMQKKMHFDIIFMDPPYQLNAEKEVLTAIADSKIADEIRRL